MKKRSRRGSKEEPLCGFCGGRNHYRKSCPKLAAELLKQVTKTCSAKHLEKLVKQKVTSETARSSKAAQDWQEMRPSFSTEKDFKRHSAEAFEKAIRKGFEERSKLRQPKAMKVQSLRDKAPLIHKDLELAYGRLCRTGWAWEPKVAVVAGSFSPCHCSMHGVGRKFFRSFVLKFQCYLLFPITCSKLIVSLLLWLLFTGLMHTGYVLLSLPSLQVRHSSF